MQGRIPSNHIFRFNVLGISADEIIKSLGDNAAFGSLKKLLKQVEDTDLVPVC
jgi:hypothetical protein